ncbi:N-acetylglucosamine kinase [Microbispora sp. CA-102843]|uniref:N-acetylglucosamine kinase n=1 Tax=Microbispora sp. CA-102843 TaxID=3239952 RepID=UPI003D8AB3A8
MTILALDGGQTGTVAVVGEPDGTVRGVGRGGPIRHPGEPGAAEGNARSLAEAVRGAAAGSAGPFTAYLSLTSALEPAAATVRSLVPVTDVRAESDAVAALASGSLGGPGIGLIAGTGTVALAAGPAGERVSRGGWGWYLGDEGSGHWIGQAALRAACAAEDGRAAESPLSRAVRRRLAVASMRAVYERVHHGRLDRAEVAALAVDVAECAGAGDAVAIGIIRAAADELAALVAATAAAAPFLTGDHRIVVPAGGVLAAGGPVCEAFGAALGTRLPGYRLALPALPPVGGAYLLAVRQAGGTVDQAVHDRLAAGLAASPHEILKGK